MKSCGVRLMGLAGAAVCQGVTFEQHHTHDFAFSAGVNGNPFNVDVKGEFEGPGVRLTVPGSYDGNGTWKIRFWPTIPGHWSLRTNLREPEGAVAGEWIDTWTGGRESLSPGAPGVHTLDKPMPFGTAPGLLIGRTGR